MPNTNIVIHSIILFYHTKQYAFPLVFVLYNTYTLKKTIFIQKKYTRHWIVIKQTHNERLKPTTLI